MFGTKAKDVENVTQERRQPEREKVVAERLNGQLAMLWVLYPMTILVGIELFLRAMSNDDDDDDEGGGVMTPVYQGAQA